MAGKTTPVVFITANVGSIFEEPSVMLKIWSQEFLSTIARLDPKFVALHCQEVGGKNYENSMQYVEDFVKLLVNSEELRLFDKARIYLDEDYSSSENFTALGNFYFIHESITDILIYDFEQHRFLEIGGKTIFSKNIENVQTKEKSKFPLEYFPECKWSRKGFLRTRWCLNGTVFDLVNIHLFHDVSNFVAIKSFPSVYSDTRRRALAYTLERFQIDEYGSVPLFLFGDFNFRTDTQGVVELLSKGLNSSSQEDEMSIIQFKQEDKVVFSLGKKEFNHSDHQTIFTSKNGDWLREFDKELKAFADQLFEFEISFPPSYPFEENSSGDKCYMKTRCPAWCDRVVLSHSAIPLVKDYNDPTNVVYSLMGRNTCMGDHKTEIVECRLSQTNVNIPTIVWSMSEILHSCAFGPSLDMSTITNTNWWRSKPVYLKFDIRSSAAKNKRPDLNSSSENQKLTNGLVSNTNSEEKNDSEKGFRTGLKYSEHEIEKLACSLEALMSQNSSFSREIESNIEPDLSRCASCRMHQNMGRVVNNPGGEEISKNNLFFEDKKIIALLASEIKVPEDLLQKIEVQDTGQKGEKETCSWNCKLNDEKVERFGAVKRVNSASFVDSGPKKEDWKNTRCNSDVSWSPAAIQNQQSAKSWKSSKQFNRGNSRIRLISSSNSLNTSLPRLTSHHSSSDEEWFEEIEEGDNDVLRMNDNRNETRESSTDIYPEYCGDKGAVAKSVKPASESISRTNLFLENQFSKSNINSQSRTLEELPMNTTSCVEIDSKDTKDLDAEKISLTGKSFDGILRLEGAKTKQKLYPRISDKESKLNPKNSKSKPFSIFKKLTEKRRDDQSKNPENKSLTRSMTRESYETLIVNPTINIKRTETANAKEEIAKSEDKKLNSLIDSQIVELKQLENTITVEIPPSTESWETIELGLKKSKETDKVTLENDISNTFQKVPKQHSNDDNDGTSCCCIIQ